MICCILFNCRSTLYIIYGINIAVLNFLYFILKPMNITKPCSSSKIAFCFSETYMCVVVSLCLCCLTVLGLFSQIVRWSNTSFQALPFVVSPPSYFVRILCSVIFFFLNGVALEINYWIKIEFWQTDASRQYLTRFMHLLKNWSKLKSHSRWIYMTKCALQRNKFMKSWSDGL